ncbi:MAG: L-2-hydroxyglutarate oxidase [Planctomycetales bacterium]|nr:L-2-hydroxyglutarate oxidase [Planctomycetales bacterium]
MSTSRDQVADVAIIGGGIVGLATAYQISSQYPDRSVMIVEKEPEVAAHQTGHNSGVLHSGIYYKPGSLKAVNCRQGKAAMVEFCAREGIAHEICGKVIVAVSEDELPALDRIFARGRENEVRCEMIGPERLAELEPHAAGIRAIHVPEAGIVDYRQVCRRLAEIVSERGGKVLTNTRATKISSGSNEVVIETTRGTVRATWVINCAGLQSDRVTKLAGDRPQAKIVPFRGEYFELIPEVHHLCRNLIYPVPDPSFPFLGVHFTRCIDGSVECGPNAVLAWAREGYRKTDVNIRDLAESLTYPGFLRLAAKYWRVGAGEMWRSVSKRAFVRALQRLVPSIQAEHLHAAPAGVRAQAISADGSMVDDFLFVSGDRILHVANAPSPAATSSLNIGGLIADQVSGWLKQP